MERLDVPKTNSYGPVIIYADDLQEIVRVIKLSSKDVTLVADDVKYDDVEELVSETKGRKPIDVMVQGRDPYITLELHRMSTRLYVGSSQPVALGLFSQIDLALKKRRRQPLIYNLVFPWVTTSLCFPILIYFGLNRVVAGLVTLFFFLLAFHIWYVLYRRTGVLLPIYRHDKPSFWQGNADKIAIAVASLVIGALLTFAGQFAIKYLDAIGFFTHLKGP